jgi:transposase
MVDLKRRVVADLLPDRTSVSFEHWLQNHPEVRIISMDRDGVYADGAYSGAPRAKQVADRFHLVQNLTKAVQEELEHQRHHLLIPATEFLGKDTIDKLVPTQKRGARPNLRQKEIRRQRRQQKVELFEMVKALQAQGMRAFEIVKATKISRGRVDKWLRLMECPPQNKMAPRPGMAEAFREDCGGCGSKVARTEGDCWRKFASSVISGVTRDWCRWCQSGAKRNVLPKR